MQHTEGTPTSGLHFYSLPKIFSFSLWFGKKKSQKLQQKKKIFLNLLPSAHHCKIWDNSADDSEMAVVSSSYWINIKLCHLCLNSFTSIPNQKIHLPIKCSCMLVFLIVLQHFFYGWMLSTPSINNWLLTWWGTWYLWLLIFNKTKTFPLDFKVSIVVPFGFVGENF